MASRTVEIILLGKDQVSPKLKGIQDSLSGMGRGLAMAGGAITAATAGIGALAMQAAPVEGIRAAFEGLTESSGESADAMLAALRESSAGMISQRDLMASYNQAAQLVSTTFANQLPNALGYLSKVAAATGQDMDYMLNSLVVGVGRGSKMILDNLGITVDIEKAYEDWAKSLGVAKDELTDEQQQAGLMNQVMTLLAKNTAAMPEVLGTAAQGIAGVQAAAADARDEIGMALIPILQELIPIFRGFIDDILPRVIPLIERFVAWFKELSPPIQMVLVAIGPLITILGGLMMALAPLIPTIAAVGSAIVGIGTPIGWIIGIIAAVGAAVALLAKAWANNWGGIQDKVRWVWESVLQPIFAKIGEVLNWIVTDVLPALGTAWETVWGFVQEVLLKAWEGFKPSLDEMAEIIRDFIDEMLPKLQEAWNTVLTWIQDKLVPWLKDELIPTIQDWWDKLEPVRVLIGDVAGAIGAFLGNTAVKALKGFLEGIAGAWDLISTAIETVVGWIQTFIGWVEDALEAWRRLSVIGGGGGGGGGGAEAGIHQSGLTYVPATPYFAMLHEGEAVLSRRQAAEWRAGMGRTTNVYVYAGGVYGMDGAQDLFDKMVRETGRYVL